MVPSKLLRKSLKMSATWFQRSGIMSPPDGSWGVAERIIVTENNEMQTRVFNDFPAYVKYDGYTIMEHRRPDCNFETALMFLLAAEIFDSNDYLLISENIIRYLYFRSGMRNTRHKDHPPHAWKWCNEQWHNNIWFDDNSWNCAIPLIIAGMKPGFDMKYKLREKSIPLAYEMLKGFDLQFRGEKKPDWKWEGSLASPHFGSLVCMAFAYAFREGKDEKFKDAIIKYHEYLLECNNEFSSSEYAYALLGASISAGITQTQSVMECAQKYADVLIKKMDVSGNIPSEWAEAPKGNHLVDLIYTQNWALLGLQTISSITNDTNYKKALGKAVKLLIEIQDTSKKKQFDGCWRGMYDMNAKKWGGGDCYEGGANSIYTGWTNAPVSITLALEIIGKSLISLALQ